MADDLQNAADSECVRIINQLSSALAANPANYPGITGPMKTELEAARDSFAEKLAAHVAAQAQAKAMRVDKDAARRQAVALARNIKNICKAGGVPDAHIVSLGIRPGSQAAPAKATVPVGAVDTSERLRHTISWKDLEADSKKRPRGSMGAEIWIKIGDPAPGDEKHCRFLTLNASAPYIAEHDPADAGKTAHYMLRWRLRDGSVTAWGETISATITG